MLRIIIAISFCFLLQTQNLAAQQPKTKVTLGIKPDYWYTFDGDGVRVKDVIPGKSAAKAGLKKGDIILKFDEHQVKDIFKYRDLLGTYQPGDSVKLIIRRGKELISKPAVF